MMTTEYIHSTSFAKEMRYGFGEYAKYVISDRAIPDARDGLKPVHRRILWAMHNLGLKPNRPFKKCARIVGETTGRYHPHAGGVYESLVRLAQDWSLRYPLVQPQGNFGSIDGFPPAAMRYTEARLARISNELLENISPKIVEFVDNFDGEEQEPTVLPVKVPHLLLNGSYGIAVGISSNIPPHNLTELMQACITILDNPNLRTEELMSIVEGPDFPTGGVIVGRRGIESLFKNGKGSLRLRSRVHLETKDTHKVKESMIVVDEIPYLQNKANIIESIANLIDDKKIRGVKNVRDLSKDDIRIEIVIEDQYADDLSVQTILAQLYKRTNLETLFHARINAFVYGAPKTLNLKQSLYVFLDFREHTVKQIAKEELEQVNARLHILEGLIIASDNIDAVIKLIQNAESRSNAHDELMQVFKLSDKQAKAVLDMTLGRLARVEQSSLKDEAAEKEQRKQELLMIINDRATRMALMKEEFQGIIDRTKDKRKTSILEVDNIYKTEGRPILHQRDLLVSATDQGYIRTIDFTSYKVQGRGGKGVAGLPIDNKANEKLNDLQVISNLDDVLLITNEGIVFQIPAYDLPEVKSRTAKGHRIKRYLDIDGVIVEFVPVEYDQFTDDKVLVTVTKNGIIKRTSLYEYRNIRKNGIRCLNLKDNDEVVSAFITDKPSYIFVASKNGQAVTFDEENVRQTSRVTQGVIGMRLVGDDEVVSAFPVPKDEYDNTSILTMTLRGYGKRTVLKDYRMTKRGAKGVRNIKTGKRNGPVVTSLPVPTKGKAIISLVNSSGTLIKVDLTKIRNIGRNTMGVRLMRLKKKETLLMATHVTDDSEEAIELKDDPTGKAPEMTIPESQKPSPEEEAEYEEEEFDDEDLEDEFDGEDLEDEEDEFDELEEN